MIAQTLSYNLRQLRSKKEWTQDDVAKQMGISIPAYSKFETGFTDINLSRIEQIAELYKISVIELLTGENIADVSQIVVLKNLLLKRDQEVIDLQKQVIELHKKIKH